MYFLINLIELASTLLYWLIFIRVIASWLRPTIRDPRFYKVLKVVYDLTEPILEPIRRLLPTGMGIDISPIIAIFLISILEGFIKSLLW